LAKFGDLGVNSFLLFLESINGGSDVAWSIGAIERAEEI
jgi:hypothetical protein